MVCQAILFRARQCAYAGNNSDEAVEYLKLLFKEIKVLQKYLPEDYSALSFEEVLIKLKSIIKQDLFNFLNSLSNQTEGSLVQLESSSPLKNYLLSLTPLGPPPNIILNSIVMRNHVGILEILLHHEANPNYQGGMSESALHTAAKSNALNCAQLLLAYGANINALDITHGDTPLIKSVDTNNNSMTKLLLRHGADKTIVSRAGLFLMAGSPVLHWACKYGHYENVETLLIFGVDVNFRNPAGQTALRIAEQYGFKKIAYLLKINGAIH